jgi:hypothetical protein
MLKSAGETLPVASPLDAHAAGDDGDLAVDLIGECRLPDVIQATLAKGRKSKA